MFSFIFGLRRTSGGGRQGEETGTAEELQESVKRGGLIGSFDSSRCVKSLKQDVEERKLGSMEVTCEGLVTRPFDGKLCLKIRKNDVPGARNIAIVQNTNELN